MPYTTICPPLKDLLPALYACVFERKEKRLRILENFSKEKGLLQRVWVVGEHYKRYAGLVLREIKRMKPKQFLSFVISITEENEISTTEKIGLVHFLIDCWYSKDVDDLLRRGCMLSPKLFRILEKNLKKHRNDCFERREKILFEKSKDVPEVDVFLDIDLISLILFQKSIIEITVNDLSSILKHELGYREFLKILFSMFLIAENKKFSDLKKRLFGCILRQFVFLKDKKIPEKVLANSLEFTINVDDKTIANILCAQRILEVHRGPAFLAIIKKVSPNVPGDLLVSFLLIFNSYANYTSKKIIAEYIKRNKYGLRLINNILLDTNIKPRGIAVGIPWELYGDLENLLKNTERAINFFRESRVPPPYRIVLLHRLLRNLKAIISINPKNIKDFHQILDAILIAIKTRSLANKFISILKRFYGCIPGFFKILKNLDKIYSNLSKRWEYYIIKNYSTLLKESKELFTVSSLKNIMDTSTDEKSFNIIVIFDGLRYDDFIMRLWPRLKHAGFKKIRILPKISLLPSITNISRRAIIMGEVPRNIIFSKEFRQKEEDILKRRFESVEYYYGPINKILNRFKKQRQHKKNIIIVLSELEKVMHGASEEIMAHFVEEYLDNIMELLMFIISKISEKTKKIYLTICSDHGLDAYIRYEILDDYVDELREKKLLDTSVEPIIKERYAIIPLTSIDAIFEAEQIYRSKEEYRNKFWLTSANKLLLENIEFTRKGARILTTLKNASSCIVLFPKGKTKFIQKRGAVYHGGLSPEEMITAYGLFLFSFSS